ncbi:MAG TPA: sigma-70 family RNA polymerase sigma factor [Bacillales bacterium]|nr:sigma-70 family RNA polymerase sigma factor [Bacillales bacterium]
MGHREGMHREQLIEQIVEQYGKAMMNFAYTYLKDWSAAEDVVQDALIKIYDRLETFEERSAVKTWLYSITANQCKDYLRKSYVRKVLPTGLREHRMRSREGLPEEQLAQKDSTEQLAGQIFSLPVKYREMIVLYYYEDLSTNEISDLLNVNVSTVKSRLQRAREKLKSVLKEGKLDA